MMIFMRTIIDLPNDLVEGLAIVAERQHKSRSALIREAIRMYLKQHRSTDMSAAFGIWASRKVDGLVYEQSLRAEWDNE